MGEQANIIYLKDWQQRLRPRPEAIAPVSLPPVTPPETFDEEKFAQREERRRMHQNLAAVAIAVAIVFAGTWMINQIQIYSRIQACLDYGHRNCVPLNLGHVARPG